MQSMIKLAMRKSFMQKLIESKQGAVEAVLKNRTSLDSDGSIIKKILMQKDNGIPKMKTSAAGEEEI